MSSQVNFGVFFNSSCSVFSMKDNPFFRGNWLGFERFQYEKCTVQRISKSSISKGYAKKKKFDFFDKYLVVFFFFLNFYSFFFSDDLRCVLGFYGHWRVRGTCGGT